MVEDNPLSHLFDIFVREWNRIIAGLNRIARDGCKRVKMSTRRSSGKSQRSAWGARFP